MCTRARAATNEIAKVVYKTIIIIIITNYCARSESVRTSVYMVRFGGPVRKSEKRMTSVDQSLNSIHTVKTYINRNYTIEGCP